MKYLQFSISNSVAVAFSLIYELKCACCDVAFSKMHVLYIYMCSPKGIWQAFKLAASEVARRERCCVREEGAMRVGLHLFSGPR